MQSTLSYLNIWKTNKNFQFEHFEMLDILPAYYPMKYKFGESKTFQANIPSLLVCKVKEIERKLFMFLQGGM